MLNLLPLTDRKHMNYVVCVDPDMSLEKIGAARALQSWLTIKSFKNGMMLIGRLSLSQLH